MKDSDNPKNLTPDQIRELLATLKARFEKNPARHPDVTWTEVDARLRKQAGKLWSLWKMEASGGEPDVVEWNQQTGETVFFDCAPESPKGRVGLCYDRAGLKSRKELRPANSAVDMAAEMGVDLLTEDQYHELQRRGEFDRKTSSWVRTPEELRKLGGALFGDRRFGRVFIYHNGAQSYYGVRGFRSALRV